MHDLRVWRMVLLRGSRGLAEAYEQGMWDSPDLVALIRLGALNAARLDRLRAKLAPLAMPAQMTKAILRRSTRARHRRTLRPRHRPIRADARSDAQLLLRGVRARPGHP
jgi:cyclopropane-fatty-acyl-phospholipid synthase